MLMVLVYNAIKLFQNCNRPLSFFFSRLVMVKVRIICLFLLSAFIIFLESRLYTVGSTIFGLFSIICLLIVSPEAYFWLVVQSLYIRFEHRVFNMYDLESNGDAAAAASKGGTDGGGGGCGGGGGQRRFRGQHSGADGQGQGALRGGGAQRR